MSSGGVSVFCLLFFYILLWLDFAHLQVSLLSTVSGQQVAAPYMRITHQGVKQSSTEAPESAPFEKERGGELELTIPLSTLSHYGGACCCKLTPCSTYQSCTGGLCERK